MFFDELLVPPRWVDEDVVGVSHVGLCQDSVLLVFAVELEARGTLSLNWEDMVLGEVVLLFFDVSLHSRLNLRRLRFEIDRFLLHFFILIVALCIHFIFDWLREA